MNRNRGLKRIIGFGLVLTALVCAGCGGGKSGESGEKEEEQKAMGRYVETEIHALEDSLSTRADFVRMEDGSLVLFDLKNGKYVSADSGETWEYEPLEWFEKMREESVVTNVAISPDGYAAVIYEEFSRPEDNPGDNPGVNPKDNTDGEAAASGTEEDSTESLDEKEAVSSEKGEELITDVDYGVNPFYRIIAPDGTKIDFEIPYENQDYLENMEFSDKGRLFGSSFDGKIYEINREDGSYELITELSDWVYEMKILGNCMVCVNAGGFTVIDLASGERKEDPALDEFAETMLGEGLKPNTRYALPAVITMEGEAVYIVSEKGIYRHAAGGNLVEQVVDGGLTALGNPSYEIRGVIKLPDNSFLVHFARGKLIRYAYDPDMPSVPDVEMKAYSLTENYKLKKVIAAYQLLHPEVYVKYVVGTEQNSSMTREDALKKLNTEIAAGEGPDILLLDDMPAASYIEKGVLMNMASYLEKLPEDLYFKNILSAMETEQGIYALPSEFTLPLIAGESTRLDRLTDLKALADETEKIREIKPEGNIFGVMSEEELLARLLPSSAASFKKSGREIDEKALKEFFTQAVRIWETEKKGITQEILQKQTDEQESFRSMGMSDEDIWAYQISFQKGITDYLMGKQDIFTGEMANEFDFSVLESAFRVEGKTDSNFDSYNGLSGQVFIPCTLLGISAKTEYPERAEELLTLMLDEEIGGNGFPVNKQMWEKLLANPYPDEEDFGAMSVGDAEGEILSLKIYWPKEEETERLRRIAETADTPYIRDPVLEEAVKSIGTKILRGEAGVEEGVAEIRKKLAIYMAE